MQKKYAGVGHPVCTKDLLQTFYIYLKFRFHVQQYFFASSVLVIKYTASTKSEFLYHAPAFSASAVTESTKNKSIWNFKDLPGNPRGPGGPGGPGGPMGPGGPDAKLDNRIAVLKAETWD